MNAVPAALIGILLSSVAAGLAQEAEITAQPSQVVFSMRRDVVGVATSPRRVRLEGAVDSGDLNGCHDPADIEWQPLAGFTAEQALVLRRRSPRLLRMFDLNTGASRYGLRLPSSRLGFVQGGDRDSRVTSRVTVIAGGSEQPVPGAQVLFLADQGRGEPLLCLLDTNSDGAAVLPLARRVFATVVAAEGFVAGVVAPDRSGTVRLRRSRTIGGRVEAVKIWAGYDLVAAIPEAKVDGEHEDIVAVAMVAPGGEFELRGIPASTSRLLLAIFRANSLIGMRPYTVSDSAAVVPLDGASVTFTSADPDAQMELRFLRLPDGTRVRDYALGRMARRTLKQDESRFSHERLPSGWYEIRADGDPLGEFFLDPDEDRDLGVLGAAEKFTLDVRGLEGRSGDVWWSRDLCFDDELDGRTTHTAIGPQQPVTLWIPEECKRIWGEVQAPGMVPDRFDWYRGQPLEAVVTLRPGFTIAGTVWAPDGQPFENARLDVFEEFRLANSRDGRFPVQAANDSADEEGHFELTVGRKTSFFVRAMYSSYFAPVHYVDLSAGSTPPLEIEMREGATVTGVVRSPSGRPVEGATVHWCYLGHEEIVLPSTFARVQGCKQERPERRDWAELALWNLEGGQTNQTDAAGTFGTEQTNVWTAALFTALPPGEIQFTVRPWAGREESSTHTLEPGDNTIEITLRNGNTIEGEVLGLPEGSRTAEVRLATGTAPDVWTRWASKTAQAVQGAFLFENLSGGPRPFHLYATAPGHQSLERHVVLQEGEGTRTVSLELVSNSSVIEGSIDPYELGSEPRLRAISRTGEERTVDAGAGGAFAFTELPVGEWRLVLNHGVPGGREEITLRRRIALAHEDSRERIDVDLGSLPTLHFVGNEPGGVLTIRSTSELDYGLGPVATVAVGETGKATIHAPAPGTYRVGYVTRPGPDGSARWYALYDQRLEGTQTFHIGDFKSVDIEG